MTERDWLQDIETQYQEVMSEGGSAVPNICPRTMGERCRLCELTGIKFNEIYLGVKASDLPEYNKNLTGILWTKKPGSKIKRDWLYADNVRDFAQTLRPSTYYYCNVVFPNGPDPTKIYVLEFTSSVFNDLIKHTRDKSSDYYGFWDGEKGTNITITKSFNTDRQMNAYEIEFRRLPSKLENMELLNRAYQLDEQIIFDGKMNGSIPIFPQKELENGPTEIRIIPFLKDVPEHWFFTVKYHYNISPGEFEAVLKGEYNPYEELIGMIGEPKEPEQHPQPAPQEIKSGTDAAQPQVRPGTDAAQPPVVTPPEAPQSTAGKPRCFGSTEWFNKEDDDCKNCPAFVQCGEEINRDSNIGQAESNWKEEEDIPI